MVTLRCCHRRMHEKCLFFLFMNGHQSCPLCRSVLVASHYMEEHVIEIHKESTLKEHPEWNPELRREQNLRRNRCYKNVALILAGLLYINMLFLINAVRSP